MANVRAQRRHLFSSYPHYTTYIPIVVVFLLWIPIMFDQFLSSPKFRQIHTRTAPWHAGVPTCAALLPEVHHWRSPCLHFGLADECMHIYILYVYDIHPYSYVYVYSIYTCMHAQTYIAKYDVNTGKNRCTACDLLYIFHDVCSFHCFRVFLEVVHLRTLCGAA